MSEFFLNDQFINSPYAYPSRHWELNEDGQPTQRIIEARRAVTFINPIPKAKKTKGKAEQQELIFDEGEGLSSKDQQYQVAGTINRLRQHVDQGRSIPNSND